MTVPLIYRFADSAGWINPDIHRFTFTHEPKERCEHDIEWIPTIVDVWRNDGVRIRLPSRQESRLALLADDLLNEQQYQYVGMYRANLVNADYWVVRVDPTKIVGYTGCPWCNAGITPDRQDCEHCGATGLGQGTRKLPVPPNPAGPQSRQGVDVPHGERQSPTGRTGPQSGTAGGHPKGTA